MFYKLYHYIIDLNFIILQRIDNIQNELKQERLNHRVKFALDSGELFLRDKLTTYGLECNRIYNQVCIDE